jgi:predicted MPP superfamily phosphohydrolase
MNVREILEGKDSSLKSSYVQTIKKFAKNRNANQEDKAIVTICDIHFWMGEVSEKQMEWLIKYANRNRIVGEQQAIKEVHDKIIEAVHDQPLGDLFKI